MKRIVSVIINPGQTILDCCAGSGTTGVAALQLGRDFIGIEIDPRYCAIAERRIEQASRQQPLFAGSSAGSDGPEAVTGEQQELI